MKQRTGLWIVSLLLMLGMLLVGTRGSAQVPWAGPQPGQSEVPPPPPPVLRNPVPAPQPATAPAAAPAPASIPGVPPKIEVSSRGSGFIFNFDNADLYEVIRVMAEVMKVNYLIDPRVRGVVNIHTTGQISADDVFPVFQSILLLNGATAVKKGDLYEIVPFSDAKKLPQSAKSEIGEKSPEEKYVIQIILLKYIAATDASKMIRPFLSDGADIVEHPPQNILIVGDMWSNVKKVLDIIELLDVDLFSGMKVRMYPIYNSDVNDVAKEMERIFASFEVSTKSGRGMGITFTPVTRTNSLLVVSSIPNIFEKVEAWLKQLDQTPASETRLGVFVYYVQNGKAKDMADVLKQIFAPSRKVTTTTTTTTTTPTTPQRPSVRPAPQPPTPPGAPAPGPEEGGVPVGEINIVVDEPTNSLIIRAYPRDYKYVIETIRKLDLYPKQVLIEVYLVSVDITDTNSFGLEWAAFQDSFTRGNTPYNWAIGGGGQTSPFALDPTQFIGNQMTGIRYAIAATGKLAAAINATAANNKTKVLSSPHLLASNNKEAKIQVGTSQPILTNTYTTAVTTGATGVVEGTIEYKDVGIIVTVTPRISDGGVVTMDISLEDSTVSTTSLGNLPNVPVFNKKAAKTTLSITDAQTIVIGGLIQDTKIVNKSGIPFLSKIPILGALFGAQSYEQDKSELMLLLTPHVISDLDRSKAVTQDFKEKLETIRKEVVKEKE